MKAIIAGVTGAVGSAIARELASSGGWAIAGLSRHPPKRPIAGVGHVRADLADAGQCRRALDGHGDATHLFYCGRATHQEQTLEDAATNLALLDNVLSAAERGPLRHVHLVQGGKVYGVHVGPVSDPGPAEDDPRAVIENFNYDQEDLLRRALRGPAVDLVGRRGRTRCCISLRISPATWPRRSGRTPRSAASSAARSTSRGRKARTAA